MTLYCGTHNWLCVQKMLNHGLNHGFFLSLFKLIPCPIHWIVCVLAYLNFIFKFKSSFSAAQNGWLCPDTYKYEFHLNCLEHSICISLADTSLSTFRLNYVMILLLLCYCSSELHKCIIFFDHISNGQTCAINLSTVLNRK